MSTITNLDDREVAQDFINQIDYFLIDCDGVCYLGNQAIEGAAETIRLLQSKGKKVIFATNNGRYSRKMVSDKLNKMGFSCVSGEVVTTSYSSAVYLRKQNVTGKVYILAEAGTTDELELAGLHVIGGGPDGDSPIDFVVQDIEAAIVSHDTHVESVKLSKICTYVSKLKDDKLFIVTNMDTRCPVANREIIMPDVGSFTALIEACTGKTPLVMGKPTPWFFQCIQEAIGKEIDPSKVAMFGDQLKTDIAFGRNNNFRASVLVGTGIDQMSDAEKIPDNMRPTHFLSKLSDLKKFL